MLPAAFVAVLFIGATALTVGCSHVDDDGADGPPTWTADVEPILSTYCGSCHEGGAGGSGGRGFVNSYADVTAPLDSQTAIDECSAVDRATCIPMRIASGSMPLDGCTLDSSAACITSDDLAVIQEWLDADAPE